MAHYPFDLLDLKIDLSEKHRLLKARPFSDFSDLTKGAAGYLPSPELSAAIGTAIAVGAPLLLTGESGTGKTQAAYYVAEKLGLGDPLHFQVKSTSQSRDLLYFFDTVGYFRDSWPKQDGGKGAVLLKDYVFEGMFWKALESRDHPRVLLLDEIDKAPRDFPNDLLLELDQMKFHVPEYGIGAESWIGLTDKGLRPIVIITSNEEHRLPGPFLRRCVYHHIEFTRDLLDKALRSRLGGMPGFSDDFLRLVIDRFLRVREVAKDKRPATGECLLWAQVLAAESKCDPAILQGPLGQLPYLSLLLKSRQSSAELRQAQG